MKRLIFTALAAFILDQWSKAWVLKHLGDRHLYYDIPGIESWAHLELTPNKGLLFGWLSNSAALVNGFILIASAVVIVFAIGEIRRRATTPTLIGTGLVIGGALGNLIDRILKGHVIDFIAVRFGFIFNLADAFILTGLAIILIAGMFARPLPDFEPTLDAPAAPADGSHETPSAVTPAATESEPVSGGTE